MTESNTNNNLQENNDNNSGDNNDQEVTITFEEMVDKATIVYEDSLGECDDKYEIVQGEVLESYYESTFETFLGVCKYQRDSGLELYEYHVMNGNHFATWYDTVSMVHVYWIECENELNIVHSNTGAASLPSKTSVTVTDKCKVSVTQLKSDKNNGMGYVIQLTDGSFIIYDGGYGTACAEELWSALVELNGGSEQGIVIRTWLITHSHIDHFTCFDMFSDSYADKVTLETVMISPLNQTDAYNNDTTKSEYKYLSIDIYSDLEKYEGVNLLYIRVCSLHTET